MDIIKDSFQNQSGGTHPEISLADMQKVQLELLHELDRICRNNHLHYALSSGTCLGAVRHQGFIPWDDDIDVYMSWKDAEKLVECQNQFQDRYFVQSYKTDSEFPSTHYRLCDSSTSCFMKDTEGLDINHGIFIDIYIYYPYPDNEFMKKKITVDSFIFRVLVANTHPKNHGKLVALLGYVVLRLYRGKIRERKIESILREYKSNRGSKYVATYFGRDIGLRKCIKYPREWFTHPKMLQFEDMKVPCPGNPEEYCRLQYGDTFMELPPVEKRQPHHEFIYASATEPYMNFKGIYY